MRTYKTFFLLLFVLIIFPVISRAEECPQRIELLRSNALTALHRMEAAFWNAAWNYKRYQEIVYNPLWEAAVNRREAFSKNLQTEGEVLYHRYRLMADQGREQAEAGMENFFRELRTVKQGLVYEDSCGGSLQTEKPADNISQFNNCMSLWNQETGDLILEVEKLFKKYQKKQKEFSELLESRLSDNPSEHDTFEDRYYHQFFEFDLKMHAHFLKSIRLIQERFELKFPAEECCKVCQADQRARWDPVLSRVKPDPQGDSGVGGNLVNNARLKLAFEQFEKEQGAEDKEAEKS